MKVIYLIGLYLFMSLLVVLENDDRNTRLVILAIIWSFAAFCHFAGWDKSDQSDHDAKRWSWKGIAVIAAMIAAIFVGANLSPAAEKLTAHALWAGLRIALVGFVTFMVAALVVGIVRMIRDRLRKR
jgi:AcrR family transcriptional regulator